MNTLQDLRATLDQHAHDVSDDPASARVAAVRGRARRVRQRRAGAVVVGAVLAVVGVVLVPSLGGDRTPPVAGAPDTMTALGWTYEQAWTVSGDDRVTVRLPESDTPRLVSWGTRGPGQVVEVRTPGESRRSSATDWDDFAWVAPGGSSRVVLAPAAGGALDVAVYELDESRPPDGVGEGALTFRDYTAGRFLLGATLGEPGEAAVEVDLTPARGTVSVATTCDDLPRGYRVHTAWSDEQGSLSSGSCDSGTAFDPGGSPNSGFPAGRHADQPSTLRMWLTRGEDGPVDDGELPDVRLGLGAYATTGIVQRIAGFDVEERLEHDGRAWGFEQLSSSRVARDGVLPSVTVPDDGGRYGVKGVVSATGTLRYSLSVDGEPAATSLTFVGDGAGGSGDLTEVPAGSKVSLRVGTPLDRLTVAGIALYRLED